MLVQNLKAMNFEAAIRGMRNPKESWIKSDSDWCLVDREAAECECGKYRYFIGPNDYNLALRLIRAGSDHRKFLRMIIISCDIEAPLYWWKQFSTYQVGVTQNSTSTMHMIMKDEITRDDFAWKEKLVGHRRILETLNDLRELYKYHPEVESPTDDREVYFRRLIGLLPSAYIYRRTVTMNYEVMRNMYHSRRNHRLEEWKDFCAIMEDELPYSEFFTIEEE